MPTKDNDLLTDIRKQMQDRLVELRPHAEEYLRIEQALKRMDSKTPGRKKAATA